MRRKVLFLFIALALPGLIYIGLKSLGKNQFAVDPLFQTGEVVSPVGCSVITAPYFVPEGFRIFQENNELFLLMLSNADSLSGGADIVSQRLMRITEVSYKIIPDQDSIRCALLLEPDLDLVLVDDERRIRGQYSSLSREEIDRLFTEIDIILGNY